MKKELAFLGLFLFNLLLVSAFSASVSVPEEFSIITPGERLTFEMDLKDQDNSEKKDVEFQYELFDKNNEKIAQSKDVKAFETQISFFSTILVPENAPKGLTILRVIIEDFFGNKDEVETSFYVENDAGGSTLLYFIIIGVVGMFVGILVGVDIMIHKKAIFGK